MVRLSYLSKFARHSLTFALHFVHGCFVMIGVMVIGSVGFLVTQHGSEGLNPRKLFADYVGLELPQAAGDSTEISVEDATDVAVAESPSEDQALTPAQRRVAAAIAKRHKISPVMAEALIRTADKEARANGLDPLLVLAVVTVESGFNPFAESVFGAQGLMQIIPKYHHDKITADKGATALFDPNENIRVGSQILKDYMRITGGNLEQALQSYAGAPNDPGMVYSNRVLSELDRLRQVAGVAKASRVASAQVAAEPAS